MERCVGSNGKYKGQSIKPKITDRSALSITSSRTLLSLPLRTITVVRSSSQRALRGPFKSGCNLSSISLIWSPPLLPEDSTGSVNVELKPYIQSCTNNTNCWTCYCQTTANVTHKVVGSARVLKPYGNSKLRILLDSYSNVKNTGRLLCHKCVMMI